MRAGGIVLFLAGVHTGGDDGVGMAAIGGLAVLGGAIADFASLRSSVNEYNLEHAKRLVPTVTPVVDANGKLTPLAGLAGTF